MKETSIGGGVPLEPVPSPLMSLEALRKALGGPIKSGAAATAAAAAANSTSNSGGNKGGVQINSTNICQCLQSHLQHLCSGASIYPHVHAQPQQHMSGKNIAGLGNSDDNLNFHSEFGRMVYTISILLMFSFVILLLMIRSIKRSGSTIEVEALLDAMRYREELDLQQRQKRRLQKAKNKVTAWLSKTNGKMWNSSPQIILPTIRTKKPVIDNATNRTNSLQSGGSYIPEIVISNTEDGHHNPTQGPCAKRNNSCTPSLSLIYDFGVDELVVNAPGALGSRKNSAANTECSEEDAATVDLSQFSDLSFNSSSDLMLVPEEDEEGLDGQECSQEQAIAGAKEQRSASVVASGASGQWPALQRPAGLGGGGHGGSPTSIGPPRTFSFKGSRNSLQLTIGNPSYSYHSAHHSSNMLGRYNQPK